MEFAPNLVPNGFIKEEPNVGTFSRARSLQDSRQIPLAAGLEERGGIVLPRSLVKIGGQEETGLIPKHRINAHDESTALLVLTREMPANYFVSYGKKTLVGTFGTFDSRFFADSRDPLIGTSGRIACLARLAAFEATRVNILASTKQRTEESDFGFGG